MLDARRFPSAALIVLISILPRTSGAQWTSDGTALCIADGNQQYPAIGADGTGGWVVAWEDERSGPSDIYAQRVTGAGVTMWEANGVPVCTATGTQWVSSAIVGDGMGGSVIAWSDRRSGADYDIYAQRLDPTGAPLWTPDGAPVCTTSTSQGGVTALSDGAGNTIVIWQEYSLGYKVYAQKIDADGVPQWDAAGVFATFGGTFAPVSDGAGGVIVTGGGGDIYAQRINANGSRLWGPNGVIVCSEDQDQLYPQIATDGIGGAIIVWQDHRNDWECGFPFTCANIFAQRVNASGAAMWTTGGVAISTAPLEQWQPYIASDAAGGGVIVWNDTRNPTNDVYAQRVNASGVPLWTAGGVAVCTSAGHQWNAVLVPDGLGGALITWGDTRGGAGSDLYAQRLDDTGSPQWAPGGVPVCTAIGDQGFPVVAPDGAEGIVITWYDGRPGITNDIYVQHLTRDGEVGPTTAVSGDAATAFFASAPCPNPLSGTMSMALRVHGGNDGISVEIYDAASRLVRRIAAVGTQGAGVLDVTWDCRDDVGNRVASGVYFIRAESVGGFAERKVTVLR